MRDLTPTHKVVIMAKAINVAPRSAIGWLTDYLTEILVEVGDLTAEQAESVWYEPASREHGCCDLFHLGGVTRVYLNGTIEQFPH